MTDTAKKSLPYALIRAFKPKDAFGEPRVFLAGMEKDAKGLPVADTYAKMGVVFGIADGIKVSKRENNAGGMEFFYGLSGTFEGMPVDPTVRNPLRTNTAWMPEEIQHGIEQLLSEHINHKTGEIVKNPEGAEQVNFAFEVGIVASAKSSTGFTWRWTPLTELSATSDPLAMIRKQLPDGALPVLQVEHKPTLATSDEGPGSAADMGDQEAEEADTTAAAGNAAVSSTLAPTKPGKAHK